MKRMVKINLPTGGMIVTIGRKQMIGCLKVEIVVPVVINEAQLNETKTKQYHIVYKGALHRYCGQRENVGKVDLDCSR